MLDLRYVVDNLDEVRAALSRRGPAAAQTLDAIGALAEERSRVIQRVQALREEKNAANADMAKLDKKSDAFKERRDALKRTLDDARRMIQNKLWRQKREESIDKFVTDLRAKANVQENPEALAKVQVRDALGNVASPKGKAEPAAKKPAATQQK